MARVRPPAVAGIFYPDDPRELEAEVRRHLEAARAALGPEEARAPAPRSLIAPHAGYVYSGPIAASAYARVASARGKLQRVLLLGPAHRVPVRGLGASSSAAFATPLGHVPLDRDAIERTLELPQVELADAAQAPEHSLEVQLPFLQVVLGDFSLVPFVVGDAAPDEVAEVIELFWDDPGTLLVVSSDLSHYYPYDTARRMDEATTRAIEALRPQDIGFEQACGRIPVQGLLVSARRRGLGARTLDLRSSGDTAGSRDAVVGYGSYAVG
jgi:AmmeMemoRadiSam system protein B